MKFVKIAIPYTPEHKDGYEDWSMVISTVDELYQYLEVDGTLFANALLTLKTNSTVSHLHAPRERVLSTVFEMAVHAAEPTEMVYPHKILAQFLSNKGQSMLRYLQQAGPLKVNQSGGYCDLENFMRTWPDARIVGEIEKDSTYYPNDNEPSACDILFLENAERVNVVFENKLCGSTDKSVYNCNDRSKTMQKIESLKEKDPKFVAGSIALAMAIAFSSEFLDPTQLDSLMTLFSKLPKKTVYICTSDEGKTRLTGHELWAVNDYTHNVVFL